jgi:hypothetical protein
MLGREEIDKALQRFVKYVTSQSKANLTRKDKNVRGKLYNSIKGNAKVSENSIEVSFEMEDYGTFQDLGVKGKSSSQKAPNSPYRFGTGSGKKGGLTEGTKQWVKDKRIQFQDTESGRFMSYDQTAFLIARSVYHKGITASRFFSKPFEKGFERLPEEIVEAYALDVEKFAQQTLNK